MTRHYTTVTNDTTFAWVTEGQARSGTLADYAKDCEAARYESVDVSATVLVPHWRDGDWRWDERVVTVAFGGYDADDYGRVTLTLDDAKVSFRIDGRA